MFTVPKSCQGHIGRDVSGPIEYMIMDIPTPASYTAKSNRI